MQKIEGLIGKKLEAYKQGGGVEIESAILSMQEMVEEKARLAGEELKLKL